MRVERDKECQRLAREYGGVIFISWHGRMMLPINQFRHRGYWALVSLSDDGEFLAEFLRLTGLHPVRGSSGRKGVRAAREMLTALEKGGSLAVTPDGPRGPSGVVQTGVVYFAQRSGKPIIPIGNSAYPRWFLKSWDRFMIPKPFARARMLFGEPLFVGADEDIETACLRVRDAINVLDERAEQDVNPCGRGETERKDLTSV